MKSIFTLITSLLCVGAAWAGELHVRVEGEGHLRFIRDGRVLYANAARLVVSGGTLRHASGPELMPMIAVSSAVGLTIAEDGTVRSGDGTVLGRLSLAVFAAGSPMRQEGDFWIASIRPRLVSPGQETTGRIVMGGGAGRLSSSGVATRGLVARANSEVSVRQNELRLGDFVTFEGDPARVRIASEIPYGRAPRVGAVLPVRRSVVVGLLDQAGLRDVQVQLPETILLRRQGQRVAWSQMVEVAREFARRDLGPVELTLAGEERELDVEEGRLQIRAVDMQRTPDAVTVRVEATVDGRRVSLRAVRLELPAGSSRLVSAGATVKVRLISGGAAAEVSGRARRAAGLGETVEIQVNTGQATILSGRVIGANLVEVRL